MEKDGEMWNDKWRQVANYFIGIINPQGKVCGLLWAQWWTFRFHKRQRISSPAEWLLPSQDGFCSMESFCQSLGSF